MTESQGNVIIAALFFLVSSQYQNDKAIWWTWYIVGMIYLVLNFTLSTIGLFK